MATPTILAQHAVQQLAESVRASVQLHPAVRRDTRGARGCGIALHCEPALRNDVMRLLPDVLAPLPDFTVVFQPEWIHVHFWVKDDAASCL